jgi:hypothetical protein
VFLQDAVDTFCASSPRFRARLYPLCRGIVPEMYARCLLWHGSCRDGCQIGMSILGKDNSIRHPGVILCLFIPTSYNFVSLGNYRCLTRSASETATSRGWLHLIPLAILLPTHIIPPCPEIECVTQSDDGTSTSKKGRAYVPHHVTLFHSKCTIDTLYITSFQSSSLQMYY